MQIAAYAAILLPEQLCLACIAFNVLPVAGVSADRRVIRTKAVKRMHPCCAVPVQLVAAG